jgi:tRNA threonylcarbamoyladenosine modification (KEOPS) complex Cgi121 subunit
MKNAGMVAASSSLSKGELLKALSKMKDAQVFDRSAISGPEHVRFAFFHAAQAFKEGTNISRSMQMEILLRAACSGQIEEAIKRAGMKDSADIAIGFVGDKKRIIQVLKLKEKKFVQDKQHLIKLFNLNPKLNLEEQIIEKMVAVQLSE